LDHFKVPWAGPGSNFTLLYEQAAMSLVKVKQVLATSRKLKTFDKLLRRIVHHNMGRMLGELELSRETAVDINETAYLRGQRYIMLFLDLLHQQEPVIFAAPGMARAPSRHLSLSWQRMTAPRTR
jgi:transposase